MEKRSFWDEFWGRKASGQKNTEWNESPSDGSLREMISGRRAIHKKAEDARAVENAEEERREKRREDEGKQRRVAEACLNASSILEDFLASASENILESAEKGWDRLRIEISMQDLPQDTLKNLRAYKALQTFCNKYGLRLHCDNDSTIVGVYDSDYGYGQSIASKHLIEIAF